jgi:hypothetical protein
MAVKGFYEARVSQYTENYEQSVTWDLRGSSAADQASSPPVCPPRPKWAPCRSTRSPWTEGAKADYNWMALLNSKLPALGLWWLMPGNLTT